MDLQHLLNYREKCIICQSDLVLNFKGDFSLKIKNTEKGLRVYSNYSGGINYLFKKDGTYSRSRKFYRFYNKPLTIHKSCVNCYLLDKSNPPLDEQEGTTLFNTKQNRYSYAIIIDCDLKSKQYVAKLLSEKIKFANDEEFMHLDTNYTRPYNDMTNLCRGKFSDTIGSIMTLNLPAIDISNISNLDQYIAKYNIYTLFS